MLPSSEASAATLAGSTSVAQAISTVEFLQQHHTKAPPQTVVSVPDISALTRAVQRGDVEAFSRLYDLYSLRLYKFLLVLLHGNENEAREISQAVFIKLAKRCAVFENEGKFWAWLCVMAKNTFIDHHRTQQRLNRLVSLNEIPTDSGPSQEEKPEHRLTEILQEVLASLPPEEREFIQAAYIDQRPLRELAEQQGQTYKAVESRLARLRQKIRERLLKHLRHENEC
jgi:RNA polymerase sigma-70 factor (ECF subfamily)